MKKIHFINKEHLILLNHLFQKANYVKEFMDLMQKTLRKIDWDWNMFIQKELRKKKNYYKRD